MKTRFEQYILKSIEDNDFSLFIQPFVDLNTQKVCGGEMLMRMYEKDGRMIIVSEILNAVEKYNMQVLLDFRVFTKCCRWISERVKHGMKDKLITCNFSKITISQSGFSSNIIGIAEGYEIDPHMIGIEVLEYENSGDDILYLENLMALHNYGFSILLDDWGRGYTSYDDLHNIPVDILKIDKSIIGKSETERGKKIFENVVSLAKQLEIKTVCEGLETDTQIHMAKYVNCDIGQGYGLYIPNELDVYAELFEKE